MLHHFTYKVVGICLSFLAVFILGSFHCKEQVTVKDLDRLITDEIPKGSSASTVTSFLDSHKIEHSNYIDYSAAPAYKEDSSFLNPKLDGKRDVISGFLSAKISNVSCKFLANWDIHIKFYFDSEGNLVDYIIYTIGTGP